MTGAERLARFGARGIAFVAELGQLAAFAGRIAAALATPPPRVRRCLDELHDVGVLSLGIIGVSGLAVGMVLGLQGYNTLVDFGAVGRMAPSMKAGVPMFWDGVIKRDPGKITSAPFAICASASSLPRPGLFHAESVTPT